MRGLLLCGLIMGLAAMAVAADKEKEPDPRQFGAVTAAPEGEGWVDLLSEENAANWKFAEMSRFEIKDGMIHIFGKKPTEYIRYTGEEFGDFQLHIEFRLAKESNSGLMFRADPADPVYKGMEIQIYDDHGGEPSRNSCGALYDVASPMFNMTNPTGEWNSLDLTVVGKHVEASMNGWKVVDVDLSKMTMPIGKFPTPLNDLPTSGFLFVQDHGDEVWYRNIKVKKL